VISVTVFIWSLLLARLRPEIDILDIFWKLN